MALTVGGWGAGGGNGGAAGATATGNIQTLGTQSAGMFVQSVGGGGGNGGSVVTAVKGGYSGNQGASSLPSNSRGTMAIGIGGDGAAGGAGGAVTVSAGTAGVDMYINALGASAPGIMAQSVGGGGGTGGSSHIETATPIKVKLSAQQTTAYTALLLNSAANLTGVAAESGVAADGKKGTSSFTDMLGLGLGMAIGGSGGSAGAGGTVNVTNHAVIVTGLSLTAATSENGEAPDNSPAIFAQSVGGGGGNGGATHDHSSFNQSAISFSMGGNGGSAAAGGAVTVTTQGTLVTTGVQSYGVLAQSVGGGGGNGGNSSTTYGSLGTASLALGLGGSGAGGGAGGAVNVSVTNGVSAYGLTPGIWTSGAQSHGIFAQSVGGGGGSAGSFTGSNAAIFESITGVGGSVDAATFGSTAITDSGVAIAVAQGASGSGGSGAAVTVNAATPISTTGAQALGILAQSLGAGGGASGSGFTNTASGTYLLALAQGTSMATAGTGGTVSLTQSKAVSTAGILAHGLVAQSLGGGGGLASDVSTTAATGGTVDIGMSLGATGGSSLAGGQVALASSGVVTTIGDLAAAIVGQSVGGGGGIAGSYYQSGGYSGEASKFQTLGATAYALGGSAGTVSGTVTQSVSTVGAGAVGLVLQSVGGGGGLAMSKTDVDSEVETAGVNSRLKLGSTTSAAGSGAAVTLNFGSQTGATSILTAGANAHAVVAQSIGGGGGLASVFNNATSGSTQGTSDIKLRGGGGNAGAVTVTIGGSTTLAAERVGAAGLVAQSVSGGGGIASVLDTLSSAAASDVTYATTFSFGSTGGSGGTSGSTTVTSYALVETGGGGGAAPGLVAQSISGGGGFAVNEISLAGTLSALTVSSTLGGSAGLSGNAGPVFLNSYGIVQTTSVASPAVVAQSISGGGGVALVALLSATSGSAVTATETLRLGATAGTSGAAGAVTSVISDVVTTLGNRSPAVLVQSIGGGGGFTGSGFNGTTVTTGHSNQYLGGAAGGSGASVSVNSGAAITTSGSLSPALVAQSIGGGGGYSASSAVTYLGGQHRGDASSVIVSSTGGITTSGTASVGVIAQSIGGGGGLATANGQAVLGTSTSSGYGGTVQVAIYGPVLTSGQNAVGVLAQSIGGGGGATLGTGNSVTASRTNGANGNGGAVTVSIYAPITTRGAGAYGVIAQSASAGGGLVMNGTSMALLTGSASASGKVTVHANASITVSGAGATGVYAQGNGDPIINVAQGVAITGGAGGTAITSDGTETYINNRGTLSTLDGAEGLAIRTLTGFAEVTNWGSVFGNLALTAGAANRVTNLSGGTLWAGSSLDLGGTGLLMNAGTLRSAGSALGATTLNGALVQTPTGVLAIRADQTLDFTPFGLSAHHQMVGALIGEIQTRGSSPLFEQIVPALLEVTTVAGLGDAYHSLGGGAVSLVPTTLVNSASAAFAGITSQMDLWRTGLRPASTALGYASSGIGSGAAGADEVGGAGRFFWAAPMASLTTGGGLSGSMAGASIGIDGELASAPALVGAAANFSTSQMQADGASAQAVSSFGSFSLYGVYEAGPAYVSAIAMAGYGSSNFDRDLSGLGLTFTTDTGLDGWILGGRIEAGYGFALGASGATLTPFAAFQPLGLRLGSGREGFGSLGAGLSYGGDTVTAMPLYLGLQLDGIWSASDGRTYAPFLRAAWMHDFSPSRDVSRSFAELPEFTFSGTDIPTVADALDLHAGIRFSAGPGLTLSAGIDAQLGDGYSTLGATGALRVRW
ncbi:MAG: hypothetical protein B7Z15_06425 [Rhizobiales bacterium 32-66-8]|nr:MAG: hypothetical protein B7Z15_06425 [Rhizobiales bacterium 32-66-8]